MLTKIRERAVDTQLQQEFLCGDANFRTLAEAIPCAMFISQGKRLHYVNHAAGGYHRICARRAFVHELDPELFPGGGIFSAGRGASQMRFQAPFPKWPLRIDVVSALARA